MRPLDYPTMRLGVYCTCNLPIPDRGDYDRTCRVHALRRRHSADPTLHPRRMVVALLGLQRTGSARPRRRVRSAQRPAGRVRHRHGLAHARWLDRLHLEPRIIPRPARVPEVAAREGAAHHAQPAPRRRRPSPRSRLPAVRAGARHRPGERQAGSLPHRGQGLRPPLLRDDSPPDGRRRRRRRRGRFLVDGLAAGGDFRGQGLGSAPVDQPPALQRHQKKGCAPNALQPLGRIG